MNRLLLSAAAVALLAFAPAADAQDSAATRQANIARHASQVAAKSAARDARVQKFVAWKSGVKARAVKGQAAASRASGAVHPARKAAAAASSGRRAEQSIANRRAKSEAAGVRASRGAAAPDAGRKAAGRAQPASPPRR